MSFETERFVHDNPPTTEQLQTLASIGVRSAVARQRLRSLRRTRGAHYFVDELDMLAETPIDEDSPLQIRHRMAVRVGARPPQDGLEKIWSLKFLDTYFVESQSEPDEWIGERSTYRFEWTRSKVLMADRTLRIVGIPRIREEDLETDLEYFRIRDDEAAVLHVSNELRAVSAEDCNELMSDMTAYFSVLESAQR